MKGREEILRLVREKGNLDSETDGMNLAELRRIHQILFEETIKTEKEKFGYAFSMGILKRKVDNATEHILRNMCRNSVEFCSRKTCDYYDPDCVSRKIRDQINRLISEMLSPTCRIG